jgi:small-conductance mechanosensitive channel
MPEQPDSDPLLHQILPSLGLTDRGSLGGYFLLLLVTAGASVLVGLGRKRLPVRGLVPRLLSGLQMALRALVAVLGLVFVARWIPTSYAPVLLWVALAAAAAAGWSARDFLPDLLAGVVILVERRIRPGVWVSGSGFAGEVHSLGPRAAKVRDQEGRMVSVPNRALLSGPVSVEPSAHPQVEVIVRVPEGTSATRARRVIQDVALLSPWRVLREPPEVRRDGEDPRVWRVRVRLVEPQFLKAFESALADQVEEGLGESGEGSPG